MCPWARDTGRVQEVAEDLVRRRALALPEAYEDEQWGLALFKLPPGRVFCFMSKGGLPVTATLKLERDDRGVALSLPWCRVAQYVGRYGWVTVDIVDAEALDAACDWLADSYWLRATARQRRLLEETPEWRGAR
jgi:hypothetical protein